RELDRLAVGVDAFLLPAGGLQRVAVAHPHLGLTRIVGKHVAVHFDRSLLLADAAQDRSLQVPVTGIARLDLERAIDLRERLADFVLAMQNDGVVVARSGEAWSELEAARQQILRVPVAPEPRSDFAEHADRRNVRWVLLQVLPEQRLRGRNAPLAQMRAR